MISEKRAWSGKLTFDAPGTTYSEQSNQQQKEIWCRKNTIKEMLRFPCSLLSNTLKRGIINSPARSIFPIKCSLPHFSRGEGAVQLRDRRKHPRPDGHLAQGQQARRGRPRRQGQGMICSLWTLIRTLVYKTSNVIHLWDSGERRIQFSQNFFALNCYQLTRLLDLSTMVTGTPVNQTIATWLSWRFKFGEALLHFGKTWDHTHTLLFGTLFARFKAG